MKRTYVGEFEEIVLLTVAGIDGDACGVALMCEIVAQTGPDLRLNQAHVALIRLEEKGIVKSAMDQTIAERGGRRKKLFSVTVQGQRALQEIRQLRESLWGRLLDPIKLSAG